VDELHSDNFRQRDTLLADSLAGIRDQLPAGLTRSERMPVDPPDVVEIWFVG
jgi:hypothetical protein